MTAKVSKRITSQTIRENAKRDLSPKWDGAADWSGEKFTAHFRDAMQYYNLNHTGKDLKPKVIDWMSRNGYDKTAIAAFKKTKDWRCQITQGALASCLLRGMPEVHSGFNQGKNSADWLKQSIQNIIDSGKEDEIPEETKKIKAEIPVIGIQDRIKEQASNISEEIDIAIDQFIINPENFDSKAFKMANLLRGKGCKAAQARYIKAQFKFGYEELLELSSGNADEQLKEAYRRYPKKHIRKLIEFYESIMNACDQIAAETKVLKKPRAKKVKPAEEQVKKLKFRISEDKLNITSIPPAGIIGCQGLIFYNVKTRKIGYAIAKNSDGLGVKGSTLLNFTEMSIQKTLRNPATQLKEFREQNTQKRFESWLNKNIKTTETKISGRINEDTILLKAYK